MDYTQLKRIIKLLTDELEKEALVEGIDITTDQWQGILDIALNKYLTDYQGMTLEEYRAMGKKKPIQYQDIQGTPDEPIIPTKEEIEQIAKSVIPEIPPPQIITQVVKETIKEKPINQIIKTTEIVKEADNSKIEELRQELLELQSSNAYIYEQMDKVRKANADLLPQNFREQWQLLTTGGMADALHTHDIRQRRGYGGVDAETVKLLMSQYAPLPLSLANGGTGATSFAANRIPYSDGSVLTSSANLTYDGTRLAIGGTGSLGQLNIGATTDSPNSSAPHIYLNSPTSGSGKNAVITWNANSSDALGLRLYSKSGVTYTEIARLQDNGSCYFKAIGTLGGMNIGDFYVQRGTSQKMDLGANGEPAFRFWGNNTSTTYTSMVTAEANVATVIPLITKQAASHSASTFETQDSSGNPRTRIDSAFNLILGGAAIASELRFLEPSASGTNYMAFKAQAMAANVTYTLPAADSLGFLKSDGAGNLSLSNYLPVQGSGRSTAQTGDVASVATFTVGAADGSFAISSNFNVTAYTAGTQAAQCTYTDETNTARTFTFTFSNLTGTLATAIGATGPYESFVAHIRCKASTAITIKTVGTAWTGTYNIEGVIIQLN